MAKRLRPEIVDLFENKNDSLRSKEEAEKILDDLPKGTIFDDAKRIETIFKKSNHSWSEVRETLDKNKDSGKITDNGFTGSSYGLSSLNLIWKFSVSSNFRPNVSTCAAALGYSPDNNHILWSNCSSPQYSLSPEYTPQVLS